VNLADAPSWVTAGAAFATAIGGAYGLVIRERKHHAVEMDRERLERASSERELLTTATAVTTTLIKELHEEIDRLRDARIQDKVECDAQIAVLQARLDILDGDLLRKLGELLDRVNANSATGLRIEHAQQGVASDLAASHQRADDAPKGDAGAAADAASRNAPEQ